MSLDQPTSSAALLLLAEAPLSDTGEPDVALLVTFLVLFTLVSVGFTADAAAGAFAGLTCLGALSAAAG